MTTKPQPYLYIREVDVGRVRALIRGKHCGISVSRKYPSFFKVLAASPSKLRDIREVLERHGITTYERLVLFERLRYIGRGVPMTEEDHRALVKELEKILGIPCDYLNPKQLEKHLEETNVTAKEHRRRGLHHEPS